MDLIPWMPYITIGVVLFAWFFGAKVRNATNTVIPFSEPISYILMLLMIVIFATWDPTDYYPAIAAFWVGYLIGYLIIGQVTSEWVGIHDVQNCYQKIHEVVYYEKDGQMYVQPQKFKDVCKHIFFGVNWPLQMPIQMVYRRRFVEFQGRFIKLKAPTIDMIDHERVPMTKDCIRIGTYKLDRNGNNKWGDDSIIGKPKYLLHFKCYRDIYKIAPYNTDAPYDFIRKTGIYVKAIKDLADAKLANIDLEIEKILRTTEGGAIMLSKLVKMTPEDLMMSPLVNEIEEIIREEDAQQGRNKALRREQAMMDERSRIQEDE